MNQYYIDLIYKEYEERILDWSQPASSTYRRLITAFVEDVNLTPMETFQRYVKRVTPEDLAPYFSEHEVMEMFR